MYVEYAHGKPAGIRLNSLGNFIRNLTTEERPMMSSRLRQLFLVTLLGVVFFSTGILAAQNTATHALTPGITSAGTLSTTSLTQVYTVTASSGQSISVTVTTKSGARLALAMTDAAGTSLGQAIATVADANAALENIAIPASGTYYLTVLDATGIPTKDIAFEITFQVGTTTTYVFLDNGSDVNPDPSWKENFVFGDIPVGRYQVITNIDGQRVVQRVDVSEGMTSFADLALHESPATVTPTATP